MTNTAPGTSMSDLAQKWQNLSTYVGTAADMMETWATHSAPFIAFLEACGFKFPDFDLSKSALPPPPLSTPSRESSEVRFGDRDFQVIQTLDFSRGFNCFELVQTGIRDNTLDPHEAPSVFFAVSNTNNGMAGFVYPANTVHASIHSALSSFFDFLNHLNPDAFTQMSQRERLDHITDSMPKQTALWLRDRITNLQADQQLVGGTDHPVGEAPPVPGGNATTN